jgi:probable F420-dependent oxidoreductase
VKLGIHFPQNDLAGDGAALRAVARAAETLGYDTLHMADHVLGTQHTDRHPELAGADDETDPFFDPFTALSYVSAITTQIELATSVLILPQRPTALVAQQAADVDLMSGGRLRLGFGTGWNHVEYEALGQDFATRGARLDEQIELLDRLWTEPLVTFHGRFDHIERACVNPRPGRAIPLWMGGFSEVAFRRAARAGDGFVFSGSVDDATRSLQRVRHHIDEAGRDGVSFGMELLARPQTTAAAVAVASRWQEVGGTHLAFITTRMGHTTASAQIDYAAQLRDAVGAVTGR